MRFFKGTVFDDSDCWDCEGVWAAIPFCSYDDVYLCDRVSDHALLLLHFNLMLFGGGDDERGIYLRDEVWVYKCGDDVWTPDCENKDEIYRRIFLVIAKNTWCIRCRFPSSLEKKRESIMMMVTNRMLSSLAKNRSRYDLLSRLFSLMRRPHMLHLKVETSMDPILAKGIYIEDERRVREYERRKGRSRPRESFVGVPSPPSALLI